MKKIQVLVLIGVLILGALMWLLMNDDKMAISNMVTDEKSEGTADDDELIPFLESVVLTQMEQDEVKGIQSVGTLSIATVPTEFNYSVQEDGTINGFNYYLALSFADALGVKLKVNEVVWDDYFALEGQIPDGLLTNPEIAYTPTIFSDVDLMCDYFTVLPWREKLFSIIPLFPVREMVIKRDDAAIERIEDLEGKTVVVFGNTSYMETLSAVEEKHNISFEYLLTNQNDNQNVMVSMGQGDFTVQDSIIALDQLGEFENLDFAFPISPVEHVGWAVEHDRSGLASLLRKYVNYIKRTGEFDAIWDLKYDISHLEYLKLIDLED